MKPFALALPLVGLCLLTPAFARAATIQVDGICTLADAITAANTDTATGGCPQGDTGADTIVLDADVTLTAADPGSTVHNGLAAGLPDVTDDLTLSAGLGSAIQRDPTYTCDATTSDPVFRFLNLEAGSLTLENVSLENGCGLASQLRGGGLYTASGTDLTLDGVTVSDFGAFSTGTSLLGGFLFSGSNQATISGSRFENFTIASSGAVSGGAFWGSTTEFSILDTTFSGFDVTAGTAIQGGALQFLDPSTLDSVVFESFVLEAGVSVQGGAIYGLFDPVQIVSSTFVDFVIDELSSSVQGGVVFLADGGELVDVDISGIEVTTIDECQGGAIYVDGDGPYEGLRVENVTCIAFELQGAAAWIDANSGVEMRDCLFRGNEGRFDGAAASGGAVYVVGAVDVLERCAFVDNRLVPMSADATGDVDGGALSADRAGIVRNVTFAGNSIQAGSGVSAGTDGYRAVGGAIYLAGASTSSFSSETIADNEAIAGKAASGFSDGEARGGGLFAELGHTIDIVGSILSGNTVTDADGATSDDDCQIDASTLTSLGYNLAVNPDASCDFSAFGDLTGVDPGLYPVDDYGCTSTLPDGSCVPTAAIDQTSWAVDWGSCADAGVQVDARGYARRQDIVGVGDLADACDVGAFEARDRDGDGITDVPDVCPDDADPDQTDSDGDAVGDACDVCAGDDASGDGDGDLICDDEDVCAGFDDGVDTDVDGVPDGCDVCQGDDATLDSDGDLVCDDEDACLGFDDGADADTDGVPDGCDACLGNDASGNDDGDLACNDLDACPGFDDGADADTDGVPDGCDACLGNDASGNDDGDQACNDVDVCPGFDDGADADIDGVPDGCDACQGDDATLDSDGDLVCDDLDVCPGFNDGADADADDVPDGCDVCLGDDLSGNYDGDLVCNDLDACPGFDDGVDSDADGVADGCDACLGNDGSGDSDGDLICNDLDACPGFDDGADSDADGVAGGCDVCLGNDAFGDSDGDLVCNDVDVCLGFDDRVDADADGVPDGCDVCMGDDASGDSDGDLICDDLDVCAGADDGVDSDGDGVADGCDICQGDDASGDSDGDLVCDDLDVCAGFDDGVDTDLDGVADGCDLCTGNDATGDADGDGLCDGLDATVGDRIWLDDGDGLQQIGEPGLEGVVVRLYDASNVWIDTTSSDASGGYAFSPGPGTYSLEFVPPAGMTFAPSDQGNDDASDSDASDGTGATPLFSLATGQVDSSRDAGLEPAMIGDRVWLDENGDGRQQPDEVGISGLTVRLLDATGTEVATTTTGADGIYGFSGVATGTYLVEVELPTNAVFSAQDVGTNDRIDSDVDPSTGRSAEFAYASASASRTHDAGLRLLPLLFADGFESGDVTAWSSSRP